MAATGKDRRGGRHYLGKASAVAPLEQEVVARSHRSVIRLFGLRFVKPGLVSRALGRLLAQEFEDRLTSDYDVESDIEAAVARQRVTDAERFVRQLERWLRQETARRRPQAR